MTSHTITRTTLYTTFDSPIGDLLLVGETTPAGTVALASVSAPGQKGGAVVQDGWRADADSFGPLIAQLRAYFDGTLTRFEFEHTTRGTEFQQKVWKALEEIPYGTTTSYGKLAETIGAPRAAVRALGTAIGANPLLLVRPCHRVVGADGSLTGYSAGLERKRQLLEHEQVAA
jgi:methylated-DNA-[protein]-cysteine S-methyltransferase